MIFHVALLWLGCAVVIATVRAEGALEVEYSWRFLEYQYDSTEDEDNARRSGAYNPKKNYPFDVEVVKDGRVFVTVRREDGVPSTLNTVTQSTGHGRGRLLKPYPSWSWTNVSNCDNLIGVIRVAQDECNRLWVLDNGQVNADYECTSKLLVFDLATDELIQRIALPRSKWETYHLKNGGLITPIIDTVGPNCSKTYVYMADSLGNHLLIWSEDDNRQIHSPFFEPEPGGDKFSVNGVDFEMSRGLMGMAITHDVPFMERLLYFRPLSSFSMYHTKTSELRQKGYFAPSVNYVKEPTQLSSQSVAQAFSSRGILFFSSVSDNSILCWNRHKPFVPENIVAVAKDGNTLQWASGLKIYTENDRESLWVLTNRFPLIETDKLNFNRINFRVLTGDVNELVRNTSCQP